MAELLFLVTSVLISIVSYAWADHGFITLISQSKPIFAKLYDFRGFMIYNRHIFERFFIIITITLTFLQLYFLYTKRKNINTKPIILGLVILIFAYPFLSTDIFSYIFAGKILYSYHLNPYNTIPETLRDKDIWLSFTYWTHRGYIYGPFYLLISIIPFLIFGAGKFLTIFYATKIISGLAFIFTGLIIKKLTRSTKKAVYLWWVNPLVVTELLINAHNDVFMIFLFMISILLWNNKKIILGIFGFISSILIKYVSAPLIIIIFTKDKRDLISKLILLTLFLYLGFRYQKIQVWYYSWIYFLVPFIKFERKSILAIIIFQTFLLLDKYYPFIRSGNWENTNSFLGRYIALFIPPISILLTQIKARKSSILTQSINKHTSLE